MGILEIRDLNLAIEGETILNGLTMDIWEGHVHALVGPNGAGKSSLAFSIMGISGYRNVEGEIHFKGEKINELSVAARAQRGITLAWQEPARYEGLTVEKFIKASPKGKDGLGVEEALKALGMDPGKYLDRKVDSSLSGGERKKIELASILAMDPSLVLLDEPDSGIDVASLERIFEAIDSLKERGVTVLMITHSETVLNRAEHAFLICCGSLIDKGKVDKIARYFGEECVPCDHKNHPQLNGERAIGAGGERE